ncbi:MAG: DUF5675 family protein [Azoarcus sp.]|nr:DUF5675 family protein [Azoarcus sp.]
MPEKDERKWGAEFLFFLSSTSTFTNKGLIGMSNETLDRNIYIKRVDSTPARTIGEIRFGRPDGPADGYVLERPGPSTVLPGTLRRIPTGTYNLVNHTSGSMGGNGYPRLHGNGVTHQRAILIHPGNTAADSEGCILPGYTRAQNSVGSSQNFMNQRVKPWLNQHGYQNVQVVITGND